MSTAVPVHRARKRFGQNFLHDSGVIERIVRAANPRGECLVEIGPGQGAITAPLLAANGRLDVVEVDRDLAAMLRQRFGAQPGFRLHEGDVLDFDFSSIDCPPEQRLHVVGNLPYNISTPLLFHLLKQRERIADMLFMLQLEVVQRLAAGPGDEHYGRLSVMAQYHCRVELLFTVPPHAFRPQPQVDSAIVRLVPHHPLPCPARDERRLERVVRTAFGQRRKTLRNALKTLIDPACLEALGIDGGQRPENLGLADYVRISDSFEPEATAP